ncbi:PASTA domain-containing protein [Oryzobacter terrae]|uniref:PASTA domain-containing protein n=1 Tax=Oryzobacter terrae TaxID=1620385 RepID=UPI00366F0BC2
MPLSSRHTIGISLATMTVFILGGCSSEAPHAMPDVVGKTLDLAKSDVKRAGIEDDVEVLGGGMLGILVESNWTVCGQEPATGSPVSDPPRLTVDRGCEGEGGESVEPEPTPAPETTAQEPEAEPEPEASPYAGPKYDVVVVDADQGPAGLNQYWVHTGRLDYATTAYRNQVKRIIEDIALTEGSNRFFAEIVTERDIALAESPSTYEDFIEEHGMEYAIKEIPKRERKGYVASYSGGYDFDLGEASEDDAAFGIDWWPAADTQNEKWKPSATG